MEVCSFQTTELLVIDLLQLIVYVGLAGGTVSIVRYYCMLKNKRILLGEKKTIKKIATDGIQLYLTHFNQRIFVCAKPSLLINLHFDVEISDCVKLQ